MYDDLVMGPESFLERNLGRLKLLAEEILAGKRARVILFGSHARGEGRISSDVDLAVEDLDAGGVALRLRDAVEESDIPLTVEVVDLAEAGAPVLEAVAREGVVWID